MDNVRFPEQAKILTNCMVKAGLKNTDIAKALNINDSTASNYRKGTREIPWGYFKQWMLTCAKQLSQRKFHAVQKHFNDIPAMVSGIPYDKLVTQY